MREQFFYFNRRVYKEQAKMQLKKHWKSPVLVFLCCTAVYCLCAIAGTAIMFNVMQEWLTQIQSISSLDNFDSESIFLFLSAYGDISSWGFLLNTIILAISGILITALAYFFLTFAKDNEKATFATFLEGLSYWFKGIRALLWYILWLFLWALLACIPMIIGDALMGISFLSGTLESPLHEISILLIIVSYIACFIILIIKSISYSQMFFILADNPDTGVLQAMRKSIAITEGYKGSLFVMALSFIGWALLINLIVGILTVVTFPASANNFASSASLLIPLAFYCIGYIFLGSYAYTSFAYAYYDMLKFSTGKSMHSLEDQTNNTEPLQNIEEHHNTDKIQD
ncbi:MAG: DUF975 family protein [Spirochaetales bacterium]